MEADRVWRSPRLEAAVVDDDVLRPGRRDGVVLERAVDADGCRRIEPLGEVAPDRRAALGAQALDQRVEEHRAPRLVAAANAEVRAEQRPHSDHVRDRPWPQPDALAAVVRVDPGDVRRRVGQQLSSFGARVPDQSELVLQALLCGLGRDELPARGRERERIDARYIHRRDPAGPAQLLHEHVPVFRRRVAGAELDIDARSAVHMRHVAAVPEDSEPGPRVLDADDLPGDAEALGLEVAREVACRDARLRRETVVERELIGGGRRKPQVSRLARRQDVERDRRVVDPLRGAARACGEQHRRERSQQRACLAGHPGEPTPVGARNDRHEDD